MRWRDSGNEMWTKLNVFLAILFIGSSILSFSRFGFSIRYLGEGFIGLGLVCILFRDYKAYFVYPYAVLIVVGSALLIAGRFA